MTTPQPTRAELEASEWLVLLDAATLPEAEIARFQTWLAASDDNKRAWAGVSETWDKLGPVLASMPRPHEAGPAPKWPPIRRARALGGRRRAPKQRRGSAAAVAVATAAALALILFWPLNLSPALHGAEAHATQARQTQTITLEDGATIELGPLARIEVAYAANERRVILSDGAAYFDVPPNPARPFIVATRFGEAHVLGTAFSMRVSSQDAEIAVVRGRVAGAAPRPVNLWTRLTRQNEPLEAGAGQVMQLLTRGPQIVALAQGAFASKLAWRDGAVALDDATLADAAREVTRYSNVSFRFAEARTGALRVSGYLRGGDVEGFLTLLSANFAIEAERDGDVIVLRAAS